jgi:pyruvate,orthophosphate dikinase
MKQGVMAQPLADRSVSASTPTKYTYFFGGGKAEGNGRMKDVLGGK